MISENIIFHEQYRSNNPFSICQVQGIKRSHLYSSGLITVKLTFYMSQPDFACDLKNKRTLLKNVLWKLLAPFPFSCCQKQRQVMRDSYCTDVHLQSHPQKVLRVNPIPHNAKFWRTLDNIVAENIVRKGEIACNKQTCPFLTMFSTLYGTYFSFWMQFKMSFAICFNLDQSKFCHLVMG